MVWLSDGDTTVRRRHLTIAKSALCIALRGKNEIFKNLLSQYSMVVLTVVTGCAVAPALC